MVASSSRWWAWWFFPFSGIWKVDTLPECASTFFEREQLWPLALMASFLFCNVCLFFSFTACHSWTQTASRSPWIWGGASRENGGLQIYKLINHCFTACCELEDLHDTGSQPKRHSWGGRNSNNNKVVGPYFFHSPEWPLASFLYSPKDQSWSPLVTRDR